MKIFAKILSVFCAGAFVAGCVLVDSPVDTDANLSSTRVKVTNKEQIVPECIIAEVKPGDYITYNPITGSSKDC